MRLALFRTVSRLEYKSKFYVRTLERERASKERTAREYGKLIIMNVAVLLLYGRPQRCESLSAAWERCKASAGWQAYVRKYRSPDGNHDFNASPFCDPHQIAQFFEQQILPDLPGRTQKEKLDAVFSEAPPWLLWFTYADVFAQIFDITMPDVSSMDTVPRKPYAIIMGLPPGPFESRPGRVIPERRPLNREVGERPPRRPERDLNPDEIYPNLDNDDDPFGGDYS